MQDRARQLIETIEKAFDGVQLEGGISLREAIVLDDYGTEEERRQARLQDETVDWRRIPDETIAAASASLAFLDARGMRFHLPACMRFAVRHYEHCDSAIIDYTIYQLEYSPEAPAEDVDFAFENMTEQQRSLLGDFGTGEGQERLKAKFAGLQADRAGRLGLLTAPQRDAVRQFLEFMVSEAAQHVDSCAARGALERVWRRHDN